MGFFLTAAVVVAVVALSARILDEPMLRRFGERPGSQSGAMGAASDPAIDRDGTREVVGRIVRITVRPPDDPGAVVAAVDDGNELVGVRLPSSVAGFIHTGELLSVKGVPVAAEEGPRIQPLEAAIVGEAGWSIQLPLRAGIGV